MPRQEIPEYPPLSSNPQTTNFNSWVDKIDFVGQDPNGSGNLQKYTPGNKKIDGSLLNEGFNLGITMSKTINITKISIIAKGEMDLGIVSGYGPYDGETNPVLNITFVPDNGSPVIILIPCSFEGTNPVLLKIPVTILESNNPTTPIIVQKTLRIHNIELKLKIGGKNRIFFPYLDNHILSFSNPPPIIYTFTANSHLVKIERTSLSSKNFTIAFNFVVIDSTKAELEDLLPTTLPTFTSLPIAVMCYCDTLALSFLYYSSIDTTTFDNSIIPSSSFTSTTLGNGSKLGIAGIIPSSLLGSNPPRYTMDTTPFPDEESAVITNRYVDPTSVSYPQLFKEIFPFFIWSFINSGFTDTSVFNGQGSFSIQLTSINLGVLIDGVAITSITLIPNITSKRTMTYVLPVTKSYMMYSTNNIYDTQAPRRLDLSYTVGGPASLKFRTKVPPPDTFTELSLVINDLKINGVKKPTTRNTITLTNGEYRCNVVLGTVNANDSIQLNLITIEGKKGTRWHRFSHLLRRVFNLVSDQQITITNFVSSTFKTPCPVPYSTNYGAYFDLTWDATSGATSYSVTSNIGTDLVVISNTSAKVFIIYNPVTTPRIFILTATTYKGKVTSTISNILPCFLAGSKVQMADNTTKTIEDVCVDDLVLGAFGEINRVLALHRPLLGSALMCKINNEHDTTNHHPHISVDRKFYCGNPELVSSSTYGRIHTVIDSSGNTVERKLDGLNKERINKLEVGTELKTVEGSRPVKTLITYSLPENTQLYNLVLSGSHTYYVDGYAVTGWPSEKDFNYDTWS